MISLSGLRDHKVTEWLRISQTVFKVKSIYFSSCKAKGTKLRRNILPNCENLPHLDRVTYEQIVFFISTEGMFVQMPYISTSWLFAFCSNSGAVEGAGVGRATGVRTEGGRVECAGPHFRMRHLPDGNTFFYPKAHRKINCSFFFKGSEGLPVC